MPKPYQSFAEFLALVSMLLRGIHTVGAVLNGNSLPGWSMGARDFQCRITKSPRPPFSKGENTVTDTFREKF
jgi:hypothetical protein